MVVRDDQGFKECQCTEDDNCSCCIHYTALEVDGDFDAEWLEVREEVAQYAYRHGYTDSLKYAYRVGRRQ